ncbi:MAG: endonuclease/exonuclease/phosphatase family protein [Promethearchaeota archaeon]
MEEIAKRWENTSDHLPQQLEITTKSGAVIRVICQNGLNKAYMKYVIEKKHGNKQFLNGSRITKEHEKKISMDHLDAREIRWKKWLGTMITKGGAMLVGLQEVSKPMQKDLMLLEKSTPFKVLISRDEWKNAEVIIYDKRRFSLVSFASIPYKVENDDHPNMMMVVKFKMTSGFQFTFINTHTEYKHHAQLDTIMSAHALQKEYVIACGDFNVDDRRFDTSFPKSRDLFLKSSLEFTHITAEEHDVEPIDKITKFDYMVYTNNWLAFSGSKRPGPYLTPAQIGVKNDLALLNRLFSTRYPKEEKKDNDEEEEGEKDNDEKKKDEKKE